MKLKPNHITMLRAAGEVGQLDNEGWCQDCLVHNFRQRSLTNKAAAQELVQAGLLDGIVGEINETTVYSAGDGPAWCRVVKRPATFYRLTPAGFCALAENSKPEARLERCRLSALVTAEVHDNREANVALINRANQAHKDWVTSGEGASRHSALEIA